MKDTNTFDSFAGATKALSTYAEYTKQLSQFNCESYKHLVDSLSSISSSAVLKDIVDRQQQLLQSLSVPAKQIEGLLPVSTLQWDALSAISKTCWTPEIAQLRTDLLDNNFSGLQTFISALNAPHIEAANIALLKSAQIFNSLSLPSGLTSAVKGMHSPTAERLLHADNISYDSSSKTFYVEENPSAAASISETNIICSGLQLLAGLDEADLIEFLNHLSEYPNLALNHPVGQKISEIIAGWDSVIDFDCSEYFHARALPEGRCPYTHAELGQAPNGVTWHGRYNFVGESHYYFSDKIKGAILEVKKHTKEPRIQIATVVPRKSVKMIDLSGDGTRNKFLEYCRFAPDTNNYSNIKREYLIPCFVANCCKFHGIEGIKYYGSKEYMNYVVWNDAYFKCVHSEIQDL